LNGYQAATDTAQAILPSSQFKPKWKSKSRKKNWIE